MSHNEAIVQFVRNIEQHPCLYDVMSPEYSNRKLKSNIWIQIAENYGWTVAECKEKWRKIRTAYARTVKPICVNGVRRYRQPYYLAQYLKFLSPVKNTNPKQRNLISSDIHRRKNDERVADKVPRSTKVYKPHVSAHKTDEQRGNTHNQSFIDTRDDTLDTTHNSDFDLDNNESVHNEVNKTKDVNNRNDHTTKTDKCKICSDSVEYNSRKMFLLSLLADVRPLNNQQMKIFKRRVIDLIDEITLEQYF